MTDPLPCRCGGRPGCTCPCHTATRYESEDPMKHDDRCELAATGGRDCHCASRAFRAEPDDVTAQRESA